jgi:hypothetical protein
MTTWTGAELFDLTPINPVVLKTFLPAKTGIANNNRTAVTNTAHANRGIRCNETFILKSIIGLFLHYSYYLHSW